MAFIQPKVIDNDRVVMGEKFDAILKKNIAAKASPAPFSFLTFIKGTYPMYLICL